MNAKVRAAIDALRAALAEGPEAMAEIVTGSMSREELESFGRIVLDKSADKIYSICRRTGQIDALTEIAQKAVNIAKGYQALGETDLSGAFAKFAMRITMMAEEELQTVKADTEAVRVEIPKPKPEPDGSLN